MPNTPAPSSYPDAWQGSNAANWLTGQTQGINDYNSWRWNSGNNSVGGWLGDPGATLATILRNLGGQAGYMGYSTLAQIMASQGKTDPTWMNLQQQAIQRQGAGTQTAMDSMLNKSGWQNSGVGAALKQAQMGDTGNKQSQLLANEAQTAEQRKRSDLELLYKMFVDPSLQGASISTGQYAANKQSEQNRSAQQQQALLSLAAMFL
jgi:hypothetical protein